MKRMVGIIGGGPAGLYMALLLKQADPSQDVTVLECNRPDDTFGSGVVFSDQTLENIRAGFAEMRWPVQYYLGRVQLERDVQRAKEMATAAQTNPTTTR